MATRFAFLGLFVSEETVWANWDTFSFVEEESVTT
jgi:hypothetical protein